MVLHWLIALGIIANVVLALSADSLPDNWVRPVIDTHKSIGITVLGLAILRVLWRVSHRPPELPRISRNGNARARTSAHGLLYLLIFALPLSGWFHDSAWKDAMSHPMYLFGIVPWPRVGFIMSQPPDLKEYLHTLLGSLHTWFGYALYVLLALHIGGALKHE